MSDGQVSFPIFPITFIYGHFCNLSAYYIYLFSLSEATFIPSSVYFQRSSISRGYKENGISSQKNFAGKGRIRIPHQHLPSSSVQCSLWWPCGFSEVKQLLSAVLPGVRVTSSLLDTEIVYSFLLGNSYSEDPNKKTSDFCRTQHMGVETMEVAKRRTRVVKHCHSHSARFQQHSTNCCQAGLHN